CTLSYADTQPTCLHCLWATMPYPCLKHMFSFLPDEDRVSANLVCQYWHTVMHSPSLWRTRHFRFCGPCCRYKPVQHVTTLNLIVNFGKYLHRLDVDVYPAYTATGAIRLERLCYLSIRGVNLNHPSWTESFSHALVEALTDFLEGSCRLNSFHVTDMNNEMNEASLACLNTEGYFDHSVAVYINSLLPGVIHNLKALTDLTLDYTCVCDNLLIALSETSLKKLSIRCCSTMLHHQVVCGDSWVILSSKCPDLKVTIVIEQIINTVDLTQILKQEIHLTNLTINNAYSTPDEQTWSAKIILQVLLHQYSWCLQHLCLDLKNWHEAIDDQLLALIKSQQILEVLSVSAFLNVSTLEKLLQLRMTNNSSLNTIKV
uniref:F-box domain-containing protein n=1 Tax=Neogobius melanostomus TaxID=47308 RepID=A0A8C6T6D2_9GOBI